MWYEQVHAKFLQKTLRCERKTAPKLTVNALFSFIQDTFRYYKNVFPLVLSFERSPFFLANFVAGNGRLMGSDLVAHSEK